MYMYTLKNLSQLHGHKVSEFINLNVFYIIDFSVCLSRTYAVLELVMWGGPLVVSLPISVPIFKLLSLI